MNEARLESILEAYCDRFDEFNHEFKGQGEPDEGFKWDAVNCFTTNWDSKADDFQTMFENSIAETGDLMDATLLSNRGIIKLLEQGETEFVRQCFKDLLDTDDNGNLDIRQNRAEDFIEKINSHLSKIMANPWRYQQTMNSVTCYLSFWKPAENYIYKYTEANNWANFMDFGDDFGSGQNFSLKIYYKMCDELLEKLKTNTDVIEKNKKRIEKREIDFDDNLHLLVYDVIRSTSAYFLYAGMDIPKQSKKERLEKAALNKKREELIQEISEHEKVLEELYVLPTTFPELIGCKVKHKVFGEGTVTSYFEKNGSDEISVDFGKKQVTLLYSAIVDATYFAFEDENISAKVRSVVEQSKKIKSLETECNSLKRELSNCGNY